MRYQHIALNQLSYGTIKMAVMTRVALAKYSTVTGLRLHYFALMTKIGFFKGFHVKLRSTFIEGLHLKPPGFSPVFFYLNYSRIYLQGKSIGSDPTQTFLTSFVKYQNFTEYGLRLALRYGCLVWPHRLVPHRLKYILQYGCPSTIGLSRRLNRLTTIVFHFFQLAHSKALWSGRHF